MSLSIGYRLEAIPGVMIDTVVPDSGSDQLMFMSAWGTDTAIKELIARLSLSRTHELRITESELLPVSNEAHKGLSISFGDRLTKETARLPNTLLGKMVHLWLIDERCLQPDHAGSTARLLVQSGQDTARAVWSAITAVSPVPLLNSWQGPVIELIESNGWSRRSPGYGSAELISLDLSSPDYIEAIADLVRRGCLTAHGVEAAAAPRPQAGLFEESPIIHAYTRADMIDDGSMIDVSDVAQSYGFRLPVGVTQMAWGSLFGAEPDSQALKEFLMACHRHIINQTRQRRDEDLDCLTMHYGPDDQDEYFVHIGPGDTPEPVLTIMMSEDR